MTTMFLPAYSGREPTRTAACSAAPEEMPTGTPSRRATRRALDTASSLETVMISS